MAEAGDYAQKAVRLEPNNADAWTELGKIQMLTNKQADAEQSFQRSIALRPKWSEAHRMLVTLFFAEKKLKEAGAFLQETAKSNGKEAEVYSLTGEWAARSGEPCA